MNYILKNGRIVDGTGKKSFIGNIGIKDGVIAKITKEDIKDGKIVIDVKDKIVSPGFIDMHSHSDMSYLLGYDALSKIYQGVTSEIVGNCGVSVIPTSEENRAETKDYLNNILEIKMKDKMLNSNNIVEYKKELNNVDLPVNIGVLIGHGTLRGGVVGFDDRKATEAELIQMCEILDKELKNGAFGLSLGLIYPTGSFSNIDELVRLAQVVKENKKILAVHMRNEGNGILDALDEMLEVARKTGVHLHISHLKVIGKPNWGLSNKLLEKIKLGKENGLNITCDQYPYNATSTYLSALVPRWGHDGGIGSMIERLINASEKLNEEILDEMGNRGGPENITVSGIQNYEKDITGKNIKEISDILGLNPLDTIKELIISSKGNVTAVYHSLDYKDVIKIMDEKYIAIASDGYAYSLDKNITLSNPHPRNFGTFPRFIQIVREENNMSLEEAIYKITKLPANILGILDRGTLEENKNADIVVFDYKEIKDNSTFENSVVKPSGIDHIFINGKPAILYGEIKDISLGGLL